MYINYAITSDGKKSPIVSSTDFINGVPASEYALKSAFAYNLLDNSDFTNPINQRGATTTTAQQQCLDRWIARISNMELSVSSNGLTLTSTATDGYIYQKLENPEKYLGKTYTFAICNSEGDILTATFTFPNSIPTSWTGFIDTKKDNMRIYCFGSKSLAVGFGINDTNALTVTIKWAALYEGEYTAETLPPYIPKGYAAELAECQRYYYKFPNGTSVYGYTGSSGTSVYIVFELPTTMRLTNPTVSMSGNLYGTFGGTGAASLTSISSSKTMGKQFELVMSSPSTLSPNTIFAGWVNGTIAVSADL